MTDLTEEQKNKIADESLKAIVTVCKMHQVDFFSLDQNIRSLLVSIFQEGVNQFVKNAVPAIWEQAGKEKYGREIPQK